MTLHAPAQHAGLADHQWMRDILIVGIAAVLAIVAVFAVVNYQAPTATRSAAEAQSLVEFRAAERGAVAVAATTEQQSITEYRAGERGTTSAQQPAVNHHPGARVPSEQTPR